MTKIKIEKIERDSGKAILVVTEIPDWLAAAKLREWAEYRGIPASAVYSFVA